MVAGVSRRPATATSPNCEFHHAGRGGLAIALASAIHVVLVVGFGVDVDGAPATGSRGLDGAALALAVGGADVSRGRAASPTFALLQDRIKRRRAAGSAGFVYLVFDLVHLDGHSLAAAPLLERKRLLADVLRPDARVRLSEHGGARRRVSSRPRRHAGSRA